MKNLMPKNHTIFSKIKFTPYNFFKKQNNLNHQMKKKSYENQDLMFKNLKEEKILKCL